MRITSTRVNGIWVKGYAGRTGILLAFNATDSSRQKLLGFALEREDFDKDGKSTGRFWLSGMLNFPGLPHEPGQLVPSNAAPIQKFRWSDYTVSVGTRYRYTVHPVYGEPGALDVRNGPSVTLQTLDPDDKQFVIFNRAVGASQAFARKFPQTAVKMYVAKHQGKKSLKDFPLPPEAYEWLSRGLLEQVTGFIESAKATQALDIAIYEFRLPVICGTVAAAIEKGVTVRLLIHAKSGSDETTNKNLKAIAAAHISKLKGDGVLIRRKPMNLMHDKFAVLSDLDHDERKPQAVLCGSTNWTKNGIYHQANVVHVVRQPKVAQMYSLQFERMVETAQKASETKKLVTSENPIDSSVSPFAGFSPRSDKSDLQAFTKDVAAAKRDVLFVTAFKQIDPALLKAVLGRPHDPILRIGLQNSATTITGFHRDRSARFVTPAMLNTGLDGWLKENKPAGHQGTIFVHAKIIVVDFTGDQRLCRKPTRSVKNHYVMCEGQ